MQAYKHTSFRPLPEASADDEEQAIRAALDTELQARVAERWKSFAPKRIKKANEVDDGRDHTEPPNPQDSLH